MTEIDYNETESTLKLNNIKQTKLKKSKAKACKKKK